MTNKHVNLLLVDVAANHIRDSTQHKLYSHSSIYTHLISYIATSSRRICLLTLKVIWRSTKITVH